VVALALFFVSGRAFAQDRPIEIGMDAGVSYQINSDLNNLPQPNVLRLGIPVQSVRVGFFVSDAISIEPSVGFDFSDVEDSGSLTLLALRGDVLYYFQSSGAAEFFVKGGGVFFWQNVSPDTGDSVSMTQFGLGGGAGVALPIVDQLKLRVGAGYVYMFENEGDGVPASSNIQGTIGLSFFTR
jgi:hypothetical protein